MWNIILQLHKGGSSSSSSTQKWKPNSYQTQVLGSQDNENSVLGNLLGNQGYMNTSADLRNAATNQLNAYNNSALGNYNYASDLANAQNQIANAQAGYSNLANGVLPGAFQANMENAIRSGVQNTVGSTINNLAGRGVINSSVTNQAMNDISKNASDTMAQQYSSNMDTLGNLYNNQINSAGASMNAAQTAQNAQYSPSLDMLNAGIGAYGTASQVLGLGGTTSSVQSQGNGGVLGAAAGLASGALSAFCFAEGTKIAMADGSEKNIEDIQEGDVVVTIGETRPENHKVVAVQRAEHEEQVYEIECIDDDFRVSRVKASATQPLMNDKNEWVEVKDIKQGDKLRSVGDVYDIRACKIEPVYDLKVEGVNNYVANGFVAFGAY